MERLNETEWYIVFTDFDTEPHWVQKVLKKGFYHCYCFRKIGDSIFLIDPSVANVDSKIYQGYSMDQLAEKLRGYPNTKVLKFKYEFDFKNRIFNTWNLAPTCVNIVKMFLGVTARAQTPYQLYLHLLKKGAIPFNY